MPDMIAIGQGLAAVKTLSDIAKTAFGLRDSAKLLEAQVEFNRQLLSVQTALATAQQEQTELAQTIRDLEKKIADLEAWETEKQRYQLVQLTSGSFAYAFKSEEQGSEPVHHICARCYEHRQKSILQKMPTNLAGMHMRVPLKYQCPDCKSEFVAAG